VDPRVRKAPAAAVIVWMARSGVLVDAAAAGD
jgi:hypothetical protein